MVKHITAGICSLLVALIAVAMLAGPAPAGQSPGPIPVEISRARGVLWVETSLPRVTMDRVRIDVLAPRRDGQGRRLWQYCRLSYVGPGAYRCGIDVARRTRAHKLEGSWLARVSADGRVGTRKAFSLN